MTDICWIYCYGEWISQFPSYLQVLIGSAEQDRYLLSGLDFTRLNEQAINLIKEE
jgi:hypothetical protein